MLEGEWLKGKISGIGHYKWSDGREYKGEWLDQKLHGIGVYKWKDGKIYNGEYSNDKKHGYGLYTLQDGRTYEGWWIDGKQHGVGQFLFEDGKSGQMKTKKGIWEDGKRIMWLENPDVIQKIESKQIDYRTFMQQLENQSRPHVSFISC